MVPNKVPDFRRRVPVELSLGIDQRKNSIPKSPAPASSLATCVISFRLSEDGQWMFVQERDWTKSVTCICPLDTVLVAPLHLLH